LQTFGFLPTDVILMGSESGGVDDPVHAAVEGRVLIPQVPGPRCLNVVSAASIAVFEALRQTARLPG
jgi:tRNA (cytidine/uridine-2'-O-)-methyltransferase